MISLEDQKFTFEQFWSTASYDKQNIYLHGLMQTKGQVKWSYCIDVCGNVTQVCHSFFLKLFQISNKRVTILKSKIISGSPLKDKRGKIIEFNKL